MMRKSWMGFVAIGTVVCAGGLLVLAQDRDEDKESERTVKESEVPAAALSALKKLAGGAAFTEFAEEIEHGITYYEGSWKGPDGNVDALVTAAGDVVEIEEKMPAEKIPGAVRASLKRVAGAEASASFERKTVYMYEAHYKKDGKGHEIIFTADGRVFHEEGHGEHEAHEEDEHDED